MLETVEDFVSAISAGSSRSLSVNEPYYYHYSRIESCTYAQCGWLQCSQPGSNNISTYIRLSLKITPRCNTRTHTCRHTHAHIRTFSLSRNNTLHKNSNFTSHFSVCPFNGMFTLPDSDSCVDSETDSDNMQKGYIGPIPMVIANLIWNITLNHLIDTDIGVKLGTVSICIRIGINIGPMYTVLKKTIAPNSIRIVIGIGVEQCKHTIRQLFVWQRFSFDSAPVMQATLPQWLFTQSPLGWYTSLGY